MPVFFIEYKLEDLADKKEQFNTFQDGIGIIKIDKNSIKILYIHYCDYWKYLFLSRDEECAIISFAPSITKNLIFCHITSKKFTNLCSKYRLLIMKKEHKKAEKFVEYIQQTTDNIYIAINEKKRQKDNNIDGLENIAEICCF